MIKSLSFALSSGKTYFFETFEKSISAPGLANDITWRRHADFAVVLEFGHILGIVDRDPDSVIVLEFADHLPERQRVQVHQPVDPAEVVRIGYPVEFEMYYA